MDDIFESVKGNIVLVLGDFNEKVGQESYYRAIIGNQSLYEESNDNGNKLVNIAPEKGLVLKSTMFPWKDIYKYTWISPTGIYKN